MSLLNRLAIYGLFSFTPRPVTPTPHRAPVKRIRFKFCVTARLRLRYPRNGTDSPRPQGMILETLFGLSLVMNVSLDTEMPAADPAAWMQMSVRQKDAALLPLVQRATECIVRQWGRGR